MSANNLIIVSIVIPVYNVCEYLSRCIESVLAQSITNFELLLIDDGSTDKSGEICDTYAYSDSRIKVFHKKNGGVSSARNLGIDHANGLWITFIDADDWVEPNFLSAFLESDKLYTFDMVVSIQYIGCDKLIDVDTDSLTAKEARDKLLMFNGFPTSLSLSFYKREVLNNLHLSTEIHFWEDFEFQYRVLLRCSLVGVSFIPTYHYFMREGSANHTDINDKVMSCMRLSTLLKETHTITEQQEADIYSFFLFQCLMMYVKSNQSSLKYCSSIISHIRHGLKFIYCSRSIKRKHQISLLLFSLFPRFTKQLLKISLRRHS